MNKFALWQNLRQPQVTLVLTDIKVIISLVEN